MASSMVYWHDTAPMMRVGSMAADLIAIPSVNPAFADSCGMSGRKDIFGEHRLAVYLADQATRLGLDVTWQKVLPGRSNLLVRLKPAGKIKARILLAPHMDTVAAREGQFNPVMRQGRLYGRGACDTKGSVTAMFLAVADLARSRVRPKNTEIVFAGLVDEEHSQAGSRALAASGLKAELAIVGEPTELAAVTAHKGSLWLRFSTRGIAAHGSTPHLGRNAIHGMSRLVGFLETDYAKALRGRPHRLLGQGTVNVGMIKGGLQPNIVPDECVILVDRRTLPGETQAKVCRDLKRRIRAAGLEARLESDKAHPCPAMETNERHPWVKAFCDSLGGKNPVGVDYFCDAAILSLAQIPSVVFGPGNIAQAHTLNEWISLRQMERARSMLGRFLASLP